MSPSAICFSTLSSATGPSRIQTATIIIRLAGWSMRSHVVSTDDMGSLRLIFPLLGLFHHSAIRRAQNWRRAFRKINLGGCDIEWRTMTQETFRDQLLAELDRSEALHARTVEDAGFAERRAALRAWQTERLARTHADLLKSRRFHDAAEFFLTELYGPGDMSRHLADVRRIVPVMAAVLPDAGLATVAHAVELNALSESLDEAMVEALGAKAADITDSAYAAAYRKVGRVEDRERQIELIALLGNALDRLTRQRFIGTALKMMRKPALLAGLGELQGFLERGYTAFGAMRGGAAEFVAIVAARERRISAALFAGDDAALTRPPD